MNPRAELEQTLMELEKHSPNLINLSRLQLALQGLRQPAGQEALRVAILGLTTDAGTPHTARRVLKALLADPLKDEESWEKALDSIDPEQPVIVRVGPNHREAELVSMSRPDSAVAELEVSSPPFNGLNLEILVMNVKAPYGAPGSVSVQALENATLVPVVDIASAESRFSPMTTPVHQSLLVTEGLMGAVNVSALPVADTIGSIRAAVDMKGLRSDDLEASFDVIDVSLAEKGIQLFRQGPQHGIEYERLWFASNMPELAKWLKSGATTSELETKSAVRQLIASLLQSTMSTIQSEKNRNVSKKLRIKDSSVTEVPLNKVLSDWAEKAHAELQEELDLAFTGKRWRKLGWWKLFWRVDDVAMLTNEMLSQRFLPTAEQKLVYLTGQIAGLDHHAPKYPQPASEANEKMSGEGRKLGPGMAVAGTNMSALPKWPGHIAFTRRYLQDETVPALQSLAQKLVLQSLGTSSVTTSLAALLYVSSFAPTLYEAGAVAALGIVYSLSRMQKKWETARGFWEGEVHEEGRKAVRAAEESIAEALRRDQAMDESSEESQKLKRAEGLAIKAEEALSRMK